MVPGAIKTQVEYYFSVPNLLQDQYLREQMDAGGWIPISHIAKFKRMSRLSQVQDPSLHPSPVLRVVSGVSGLHEPH